MSEKKIKCLITAGPTREYFDPVRFISNPSSGKMGYALAEAALAIGWTVDLVSGPVALVAPEQAELHKVMTGDEMYDAVERLFPACDVLIMAAAVCDMRPQSFAEQKVKKESLSMTIKMESTIDIIKTISQKKAAHQTLIGFAAETNDVEAHARKKRADKKLDWIVANQVGGENNAFESNDNAITLIGPNEVMVKLGPCDKKEIARQMVDYLQPYLNPNDALASHDLQ